MRIEVRTTQRLRSLAEYIRQHAFLRLGQFGGEVRHVEARLFDDGDTYKSCRLVVELARQQTEEVWFGPRIIVTEASCDDAFDAIDLAVDKVLTRLTKLHHKDDRPSGIRLAVEADAHLARTGS